MLANASEAPAGIRAGRGLRLRWGWDTVGPGPSTSKGAVHMGIWGRVFAAGYDRFMAKAEREGLAAHRETLLGHAKGDVLEIGGGTGANLARYGPELRSLTVTEPEKP